MDQQDKPKHPGSENLKPFPPGVSGNPAGKKPGTLNRSTIFKNLLESKAFDKFTENQKKILGDDFKPENVAEQIAASLLLTSMGGGKGAVAAAKELLDSTFGKLTEKVDNTHSFTQMGTIQISSSVPNPGQINAAPPSSKPFDFEVGESAPKIENGSDVT